jgi:mannose-6-phosphate isomerase-like protein (cupin superfamily)
MSVVVFTAITVLAVMVMLTVMGMLVTSLILTTWPGRRKCHALRMPAKRRRIIVISPGIRSREPEPQSHEGYEWLYVLNGRLRLVLGEHDLVLTPGEAAEFDTRVPHWFGAADAKPVEFLSLFGRQG